MNKQKNYSVNIFILFSLFAFSSNIAPLATVIPESLTTIDKVDFEIDKMKKEIRQQRVAELTRIKNKKIFEQLNKKPETTEDKLIEFDLIMQLRSARTTEEDNLIRYEAESKQRLAKATSYFELFFPYYYYPFLYSSPHYRNTPRLIPDAFCQCMQEEKINPNGIELEYLLNSENEPNRLATAVTSIKTTTMPNEITILKKLSIVAEGIIIWDALTLLPENYQLFSFKHELEHLILSHGYERAQIKATYNNPNLDLLTSIYEVEADIRVASKSLELAESGMKHQCAYGHRDILDNNDHCEKMTRMYELMKRKKELS